MLNTYIAQLLSVGRPESRPALDQYVFSLERFRFRPAECIPVNRDGKRWRVQCLNTLVSPSLESCNLETADE